MILTLQVLGYRDVESMADAQLETAYNNSVGSDYTSIYSDLLYWRALMVMSLVKLGGYGEAAEHVRPLG